MNADHARRRAATSAVVRSSLRTAKDEEALDDAFRETLFTASDWMPVAHKAVPRWQTVRLRPQPGPAVWAAYANMMSMRRYAGTAHRFALACYMSVGDWTEMLYDARIPARTRLKLCQFCRGYAGLIAIGDGDLSGVPLADSLVLATVASMTEALLHLPGMLGPRSRKLRLT